VAGVAIEHPRSCHPVGPSTELLVCDEPGCEFSPMLLSHPNEYKEKFEDIGGWDGHWDTHEESRGY
jgi:hypothetical protein